MFHAVICDPPYGIRAGARKTGVPGREIKRMTPEERLTFIPATSVYHTADVCDRGLDAHNACWGLLSTARSVRVVRVWMKQRCDGVATLRWFLWWCR